MDTTVQGAVEDVYVFTVVFKLIKSFKKYGRFGHLSTKQICDGRGG